MRTACITTGTGCGPTGNGDLGNQGIHQMDIARWSLGKSALSPRVFSVGGRLGYVDDGETPTPSLSSMITATRSLIFEVRGLPAKAGVKEMDRYRGQDVGTRNRVRRRLSGRNYRLRQAGKGNQEVRVAGRKPPRKLHPRRAQPQALRPDRRDPGRASFKRSVPHRQYLLPAGQGMQSGRDARSAQSQQGGVRDAGSIPGTLDRERRRPPGQESHNGRILDHGSQDRTIHRQRQSQPAPHSRLSQAFRRPGEGLTLSGFASSR